METVSGNLLDAFNSDFDCCGIIHVANCQKTMNSGVGKALREKWPQVYQTDVDFFTVKDTDRLGRITVADVEDCRVVFNIYAQLKFGYDGKRYLSYEGLYRGLELVAKTCKDLKLNKIACPWKMGSDRAGGDWRIVEKMIDCIFGDIGIETIAFKI